MLIALAALMISCVAGNCQAGMRFEVYKDDACRQKADQSKQIVIQAESIKKHYNQCNNHPTKQKSYAFKCNSVGIEHEFYG